MKKPKVKIYTCNKIKKNKKNYLDKNRSYCIEKIKKEKYENRKNIHNHKKKKRGNVEIKSEKDR